MELKVGMYVRIKGYIGTYIFKVVKVKGDEIYNFYKDETNLSYGLRQDVIKASYDITDLIEKNDLIKSGSKIIQVTDKMLKMRDEQGIFGLPNHDHVFIDKINVDKILIHEQFESMAYKVD